LTGRLLHFHFLLLAGAQRPGVVRLSAQPLNRRSDRLLIGRERLTDRGIIVDVVGHHGYDGWKIHQCDERGIESLFLGRIGECGSRQAGIRLQPGVDIQDFLRIRRRCGDLGQQRIRVERNRRQQLIQLLLRWRCGYLRPNQRAGPLQRHQHDQQGSQYRT
jgi:hypothetical protein